jgi:hypothetical protein
MFIKMNSNYYIINLLEEMEKKRSQIKNLEKEYEVTKKIIKKFMNENQTKNCKMGDFTIKINTIHRQSITKDTIPCDLWEKYSTITQYDTINIKKK